MKRICLYVTALALAVSCARTVEFSEAAILSPLADGPEIINGQVSEENLVAGTLNVKVDANLAGLLEASSDENGVVKVSAIPSLTKAGVLSMHRLFPPAGEFEARTRAEGLHLWYVIGYDENVSATKAASGVGLIEGVNLIEFNPKIEIVGNPEVISYENVAAPSAESSLPFNDPMLDQQWHYYNNGRLQSAVSGCDVNVVPVWNKYTTGNKEIIVSVVDGGIDYKHEDLAANMWNNPDQKGENVFGYNFASSTYNIHPEDHGTHVAGTIAAVNNNGKGVCGIAGGDARKNQSGVKLMSCQIFDGSSQGSGPTAIKWGADHGAVISQNSWGYVDIHSTPSSLVSAVDYFIKYAGVDASGNQTGPMKGGVVIFAAGNEGVDFSGNDYGPIINVTSLAADYKRAYYSNYGNWCDIAAPGGDYKKGTQILSTLPNNSYGRMQGTSMACPHVSGVAALIASKYAAMGFTAESLTKRLLDSATDISSFNPNHYLGKGLVNAYKAIAGSGGKAPETPSNLSAAVKSNTVSLSVKIPKDSDDGLPSSIFIYYSTSDFKNVKGLSFANFYTDGYKAGDMLQGEIKSLEFDKTYYMVAVACDLAGNQSGMSNKVTVRTTSNNAPVITIKGENQFSFKPHENVVLDFDVVDEDDHFCQISFRGEMPGMYVDTLDTNHPKVRLVGAEIPSASYEARIVATDAYGAADSLDFGFTVLENHKPQVAGKLEDMIYTSKAAVTSQLKADDYFIDEDGETLKYEVTLDNTSVFNVTEAKGFFNMTPLAYGYCNVDIKAVDVRGESVSQSFKVLIRDGSSSVDVYPNPVKDNLYLRTSRETDAEVIITNQSGAKVIDEKLSISPFAPARVDMSSKPSGLYSVSVKIEGEVTAKTIVKI